MKINVYICNFGSGHRMAAKEIENYIISNKDADINTIDFIEAIHPKFSKMIYWGHKTYFQYLKPKKEKEFKNNYETKEIASKIFNIKNLFFKYLDENPLPDIFISCYSVTSFLLSLYKEERNLDIPLITYITDFNFHKYWINPRTDLYLTLSNYTKNKLIDIGIKEDRIIIFGIKEDLEKQKANQNILVCGGGLGMLPNDEKFYKSFEKFEDKKFVVVCGKNKKLYEKISKLNIKNLQVYGLVKDMKALYSWADFYITKPGGMSTYDSIKYNIPIFYFTPYLSQEIKNKNFIDAESIGIELQNNNLNTLKYIFDDLEKIKNIKDNLNRVRNDYKPEELIRWMNNDYYKIMLNPYNNFYRPWLRGYIYS